MCTKHTSSHSTGGANNCPSTFLHKQVAALEASLELKRGKSTRGAFGSESKTHQKLRIIAGTAANRRLVSSQGAQTRPMMEKVRVCMCVRVRGWGGVGCGGGHTYFLLLLLLGQPTKQAQPTCNRHNHMPPLPLTFQACPAPPASHIPHPTQPHPQPKLLPRCAPPSST